MKRLLAVAGLVMLPFVAFAEERVVLKRLAAGACGNIANGQECSKDCQSSICKIYVCNGTSFQFTNKYCNTAGGPSCAQYPSCNQ